MDALTSAAPPSSTASSTTRTPERQRPGARQLHCHQPRRRRLRKSAGNRHPRVPAGSGTPNARTASSRMTQPPTTGRGAQVAPGRQWSAAMLAWAAISGDVQTTLPARRPGAPTSAAAIRPALLAMTGLPAPMAATNLSSRSSSSISRARALHPHHGLRGPGKEPGPEGGLSARRSVAADLELRLSATPEPDGVKL